METDRKRPRMEEEYAYPPIPSSDQDNDGPREATYNDPFTFRHVPSKWILSMPWISNIVVSLMFDLI